MVIDVIILYIFHNTYQLLVPILPDNFESKILIKSGILCFSF